MPATTSSVPVRATPATLPSEPPAAPPAAIPTVVPPASRDSCRDVSPEAAFNRQLGRFIKNTSAKRDELVETAIAAREDAAAAGRQLKQLRNAITIEEKKLTGCESCCWLPLLSPRARAARTALQGLRKQESATTKARDEAARRSLMAQMSQLLFQQRAESTLREHVMSLVRAHVAAHPTAAMQAAQAQSDAAALQMDDAKVAHAALTATTAPARDALAAINAAAAAAAAAATATDRAALLATLSAAAQRVAETAMSFAARCPSFAATDAVTALRAASAALAAPNTMSEDQAASQVAACSRELAAIGSAAAKAMDVLTAAAQQAEQRDIEALELSVATTLADLEPRIVEALTR